MIATLKGFTQRLVRVNGIKINAVTGGSGPPILLLHGWLETWWEWHHVMPLLAEHFSVVAIDLRGAGFSDCPLDGYDKATMARDAHEVMVALGHQRYAVCGHDIGGMVALPQAAVYRQAVTHLAVLDVPLPGWSQWEATTSKIWHFSFHMNRDLPERLIHGREYDYISAFMAERFYDHSTFDPADIAIFANAMALPGRTRGGMEWYRTLAADHAAALEYKKQALKIPVLGLGGDHRFGAEWSRCSRNSPARSRAARLRGAATMSRTSGRTKWPLLSSVSSSPIKIPQRPITGGRDHDLAGGSRPHLSFDRLNKKGRLS